jgi:hypothetical protein
MNKKTYRKVATVEAKLFEVGDEDGMVATCESGTKPYISTLENQRHLGSFGEHYVCTGIDGERWLVDKGIFERTYEEVK